jgi:hypothetical protein
VRRKNRNSKIFSILELENPSPCDGKIDVISLVLELEGKKQFIRLV